MKRNLAIIVFALFAVFVMNTAMAESECQPVTGPVYTETGMSGR